MEINPELIHKILQSINFTQDDDSDSDSDSDFDPDEYDTTDSEDDEFYDNTEEDEDDLSHIDIKNILDIKNPKCLPDK